MSHSPASEQKGRRVSIDLTPPAAREVDRLRAATHLSTADIFRYSLSLFRLYVDARQKGHQLAVIDPSNDGARVLLELPVSVDLVKS